MGVFSSIFKAITSIITDVISWIIPIPDIPDIGQNEFEKGILVNPKIVAFFKSDKVPLQSFIEAYRFTWIAGECNSSLTFYGIVEPCDRSTEVLSFFLREVKTAI